MTEQKAELRSGITAPFNKRLNEALQFDPQMPFDIENNVSPSLVLGVLKGEQGTPGLPASVSVVKDLNNYVALLTTTLELGTLRVIRIDSTLSVAGGETNIVDTIVPKSKKWVLKKILTENSTFSGTQSSISVQFRDPTNTISMNIQTSPTNIDYLPPQQITFNADAVIRTRIGTSAWTSGQKIIYLLVQEITV